MINVLPKNIADKIAAGEVIERPISMVKELVENSIDAGATSIICEIKNGGKTFLRITDNGCGIPREEAETAFLRHATSKISTMADLLSISSLGFRGEALASIVAVTRTSLITKTADRETGCRVVIHGGEIIENSAVGCPDGTTIIVTDLFYNMPARQKFLKSDGAEAGLIIDFLSEVALAYPNIRFQLINNGNILFTTTGSGDLQQTIQNVYHQKDFYDLLPVDYTEDGYHLEGCISKVSLSRTTKRDQVFFVNGRSIKSKVMERGVTEGYRERLFEGRYAIAFLFLSMDPSALDVNIHPNKKEIRFHEEKRVVEFIRKAIVSTLATQQSIVEARDFTTKDYAVTPEQPASAKAKQEEPKKTRTIDVQDVETEQVDLKNILSSMRAETLREKQTAYRAQTTPAVRESGTSDVSPISETGERAKITETATAEKENKPSLSIDAPNQKPFDFLDLRITGSIFDTYITAESYDGFYLIDQHAAQERIFYEQLVGEYNASDKPSQSILTPFTIDVSLSVKENEYDWLDSLRDMGYGMEEFGPNTYIVKEIPYFMTISEAESFVKDYIEQTSEGTNLGNTVVIDKLITRSCKAAIKAHDKLSMMEMQALLADLATCRNPFSCPHGRPTCVRLTHYDIEKMFKRA